MSATEPAAPLAPGGIDRRQVARTPRRVYGVLRFVTVTSLLLAAVAIMSVLLSVLNDPSTSGPVLLTLINANVLIILVFALYIGRKAMLMFLERRGRLRRSRLPLRFLGVFSVLAVLPAMVVSIYAFYILNAGLETWFSAKVTNALEGSLRVAQAYLEENENSLLVEARSLAQDPNIADPTFLLDPLAMRDELTKEQEARGLESLSLYDRHGILISSSGGAVLSANDIATMLEETATQAKVLTDYTAQRITVLAPVRNGTWLLVAKALHPGVLARVDQTEEAYKEYYGLLKDRDSIRLLFTLFLLLLALGTLAGAIWAGLRLAGKIVRPVTELVHATNKVSAGELEIRLTPHDDDEMGILTQSFNRMTQQLKHNRTLVEKKNKELDSRRKTMEALLTGVSAGVVALDEHGIVTTANKTAREEYDIRVGQRLDKVSPALAEVFTEFMAQPRELWQQQLRAERKNGEAVTLLVRLVPQRVGGGKINAVVVTFDDVSPLLSAQKVAAWSDVARRLAHEIKNPLTPIQLSAERLKRKYLDKLEEEDKELFSQLTSTIIRQTEDMRQLLNEFSDFARMPTPQFAHENLLKILDDILLLERTGRTDITFITDYQIEPEEGLINCDRSHLTRVFTNVIENAVNAIHERDDAQKDVPGEVKIVVKMSQADTLSVTVLDNGRGLPVDVDVNNLFDPYVTTRKKGTGLGLAIVRRVMDEHSGQVRLSRRPEGGTGVELTLPGVPAQGADQPETDADAA